MQVARSLARPLHLATALIVAAFSLAMFSQAKADESLRRDALTFDRFQFDDAKKIDWVRRAGNLSGQIPGSPERATGWVEYDFKIKRSGWYRLNVTPGGQAHEFLLDGTRRYYGRGKAIGNLWLSAGPHTLRIERLHWTGFAPIIDWTLTPASERVDERMHIEIQNRHNALRLGENLSLAIWHTALPGATELEFRAIEIDTGEAAGAVRMELPSESPDLREARAELRCTRQGVFRLGCFANGKEVKLPGIWPEAFTVVDTTPVVSTAAELRKKLIAEIDCAARTPDFFRGGAPEVVTKTWGAYRQSGDVGYLQHMNATEPSWFAYRFQVDDPRALYWLEFDYPDDAKRTFVVVVRTGNAQRYAGPATGPDCGREFSLSHRMQTMGMFFWPLDTDLRVMVLQPQSGLRAAVAKVRVYKIEEPLAPLPVAQANGRDFIHWYEEGLSYVEFFGGESMKASKTLVASENWASTMAHMGASLLLPTVSVYQMAMYPSRYNVTFADSNTDDAVRVVELMCEKYGLKFAGEFHPEARQLRWPSAQRETASSIYQINRHGQIRQSRSDPLYDFLHPEVERYVLGMMEEYAERYADSPSFAGASLRIMAWQNTGFGNFGGMEWGYGDATIARFERDTGITVPVATDDPERFNRRYAWLSGEKKSEWMTWRRQQATAFFTKVRDALRRHAKRAKLMLACSLETQDLAGYGIDPSGIAQEEGLEFVRLTTYGRRKTEAVDQRNRDASLNPVSLSSWTPESAPARILTTMAYFEANNAVAPPEDLGYAPGTKHGWVSGAINPAGIHYLERFALALAEGDAVVLGDGGNGYSLGQPQLRTFLREFRALPAQPFQLRADARDPVAIWERNMDGAFTFYAVNRERYPVSVAIQFAAPVAIKHLATGESASLHEDTLRLELQPYELRTFVAPSDTHIRKVVTGIPASDLARVQAMTAWLRRLADDVTHGRTGAGLSEAQRIRIREAAAEAETCLAEGRYWRARTLQENQDLREIYLECGRVPELMDDSGPLKELDDALSGPALLACASGPAVSLTQSETLDRDWPGQQAVVSASGPLVFRIDVPVDGQYRLVLGRVVGEGFAASHLQVDDQAGELLTARTGKPRGLLAISSAPVRLAKGSHRVSQTPQDGERQGVIFLRLLPVYEDIMANRWMIAGPFVATQATGPDAAVALAAAMKNRAFAPEREREFGAPLDDGAGRVLRWRRAEGDRDFVNLQSLGGEAATSISYAVGHIISPAAYDVRIAYSADYFARIWINGEVVEDYFHPSGNPAKRQQTRIIHLRPGVNEILFKVAAGSMGNGFWFSVNNPGDLCFELAASSARE